MIITVDKELLLKAVGIADSCIGSKNSNTILSNCLFNVKKDSIELIATDQEISIKTIIDAESDKVGSFAVSGKKTMQIIKELPVGDVVLDVTNNYSINVKSHSVKGKYTLLGQSGAEFPDITNIDSDNSIELDQAEFKDMFKKVMYAAAADPVKPVFNGVYVSFQKGNIAMVATDSRRLAIITQSLCSVGEHEETGIIIPLKAVMQVMRVLSTGTMKFSFSSSQCSFEIGETIIISRLVEGHFPNYRQVIPEKQNTVATIDTKKLSDALRRSIIFTREPTNKIVMTFSKNKLVIDATTPELGESKEELSIDGESVEAVTLGINCKFLMDSLKEIETPFVNIGLTDSMKPLTVTPEVHDNNTHVIMPIQAGKEA